MAATANILTSEISDQAGEVKGAGRLCAIAKWEHEAQAERVGREGKGGGGGRSDAGGAVGLGN